MSQNGSEGSTSGLPPICRICNGKIMKDEMKCTDNKHTFHLSCFKSALDNGNRKFCVISRKRNGLIGGISNYSNKSNPLAGFDIKQAFEENIEIFTLNTKEQIRTAINDSMKRINNNCTESSAALTEIVKQQPARID